MIRALSIYFMVGLLTLAGLSLAAARATAPDAGTEIAICAGTTMTTIVVGDDGQPIKTVHVCPDGASIFAATFNLPMMTQPVARLLTAILPTRSRSFTTRNALSPSARGPPALV